MPEQPKTYFKELVIAIETEREPPDLPTLCESIETAVRYSAERGELPDGPESVASVKSLAVIEHPGALRSQLRDMLFRRSVRSNPGWSDRDVAHALEILLALGGTLDALRENMTPGKFIILSSGEMDYAEFDTWTAAFEHQVKHALAGVIWQIPEK